MKYVYDSNCKIKNLFTPFASDTNNCERKADAVRFLKNHESALAKIIETETDCSADYYIFGDMKVIATANMFDNATLIAETFAAHSPYYQIVDVMSHEGLLCHYLATDWNNDRKNHIQR